MDFEIQGRLVKALEQIAEHLESIDSSINKYGHEICVQGREIPNDVSLSLGGISSSLHDIAKNTDNI